MQANIHPEYKEIKVVCSCGNTFVTRSTSGRDIHLEICSACHPFFTGTQKMVDTAGRVERFRKKYSKAATTVENSPKEGA
jgi:large subunit ribosomal protein L31